MVFLYPIVGAVAVTSIGFFAHILAVAGMGVAVSSNDELYRINRIIQAPQELKKRITYDPDRDLDLASTRKKIVDFLKNASIAQLVSSQHNNRIQNMIIDPTKNSTISHFHSDFWTGIIVGHDLLDKGSSPESHKFYEKVASLMRLYSKTAKKNVNYRAEILAQARSQVSWIEKQEKTEKERLEKELNDWKHSQYQILDASFDQAISRIAKICRT